MKKRTQICITTVAVLLISAIAAVFALGDSDAPFRLIGRASAQTNTETDGRAALAVYQGVPVTADDVEFQKTWINNTQTEQEALEQILTDRILVEEAKARGLYPTQAEIDAFLSSQRAIYEQYPEAAKTISDFCAGADITLEEYWSRMEMLAPDRLARENVLRQVIADYCAAHELLTDPNSDDYETAKKAAGPAYRAKLLEQHADEIEYYLPADK